MPTGFFIVTVALGTPSPEPSPPHGIAASIVTGLTVGFSARQAEGCRRLFGAASLITNQSPPVQAGGFLLRFVCLGMRQRSLMITHAAKITAIDPAAAGRAFDECSPMRTADLPSRFPDVFAARNVSQ
jgi:hypothetical protein